MPNKLDKKKRKKKPLRRKREKKEGGEKQDSAPDLAPRATRNDPREKEMMNVQFDGFRRIDIANSIFVSIVILNVFHKALENLGFNGPTTRFREMEYPRSSQLCVIRQYLYYLTLYPYYF